MLDKLTMLDKFDHVGGLTMLVGQFLGDHVGSTYLEFDHVG